MARRRGVAEPCSNVVGLRARGSADLFDWERDERDERRTAVMAFTDLEWALIVAALEQSNAHAMTELAADVRRQLRNGAA
jgi:hypothetical protein